jgi:hypothetical protein
MTAPLGGLMFFMAASQSERIRNPKTISPALATTPARIPPAMTRPRLILPGIVPSSYSEVAISD